MAYTTQERVSSHVSFRDPAGSLATVGDRIVRYVRPQARDVLRTFLVSEPARALTEAGKLVRTRELPASETASLRGVFPIDEDGEDGAFIVEHDRIPFASYPYEWSPGMLAAAARLTLEIAQQSIAAGFALKDATPYNVLFRGPKPVFVDVLSFERHDPHESTWMTCGQFLRTFVYPLLASRHLGRTLADIFITDRDGLEPEEVYAAAGLKRLVPPFLGLVSIPTWLGRSRTAERAGFYRRRQVADPEQAHFMLAAMFRSLHNKVDSLAPRVDAAAVDEYMRRANNYSAEDAAIKEQFVRNVVAECRPSAVLDIGCNNGHFSSIAAASGARTVALDRSPDYLDAVWERASEAGLDILPLHVNIARPAGGIGWNNEECPSFLDRSRGQFDMVFLLAVVHHLVVSERIPLDRIIDLLAELTTRHVLIEFVSKDDTMFQKVTRGREVLYEHFTQEFFEGACARRFRILKTCEYQSAKRRIYLLERR